MNGAEQLNRGHQNISLRIVTFERARLSRPVPFPTKLARSRSNASEVSGNSAAFGGVIFAFGTQDAQFLVLLPEEAAISATSGEEFRQKGNDWGTNRPRGTATRAENGLTH